MPDQNITVAVNVRNLEEVKELRRELERIKELKKEIKEIENERDTPEIFPEDDEEDDTDFPDIGDPEPPKPPRPWFPTDPDKRFPKYFCKDEDTNSFSLEVENDEDENLIADTTFQV